jgi:hypothetical protein
MIFRVGIENNNDNRTIAWALEHPGCFAYGEDADSACHNLEEAIREYDAWIHQYVDQTGLAVDDLQIDTQETFEAYFVDKNLERVQGADDYMVESFFNFDKEPLVQEEIKRALFMLDWSRLDLIKTIAPLTPDKKDEPYPNERWSINGILKHIATAEWWYLERLGKAFPKDELEKEPLPRLVQTRQHFNQTLPELEGLKQVVGRDGETWSPRKVLRRTLWHERDHIGHIRKLI